MIKNHASGSPYYDVEILSTPILEAFTNNASSMKSKLISISRNDLLFLPIVKLDESSRAVQRESTFNVFVLAADENTESNGTSIGSGTGIAFDDAGKQQQGVLLGESLTDNKNHIRVVQGLETDGKISPQVNLDADLVETAYMVEVDNRLCSIVSHNGNIRAPLSFIDDDKCCFILFNFR